MEHTRELHSAFRKRHAVLCLKLDWAHCTCTFAEAHSVNCINLTHYYHQRELHLLASSSHKAISSTFHSIPYSNRRTFVTCFCRGCANASIYLCMLVRFESERKSCREVKRTENTTVAKTMINSTVLSKTFKGK